MAVISHAFWQRHFGGAPDVIGRTLTLERIPFTIIGVTERGSSAWMSAARTTSPSRSASSRSSRREGITAGSPQFVVVAVMVRLKAGQTFEQGRRCCALQAQIREATLPARRRRR